MDEEQRYLFDTRGVFTIPGALSPGQVRELNRIFDEVEREQDGRMAGDALHWGAAYRELLDLPHISPILEELIGNHREDRVSEAAAKGGIPTFRIDHINVHNRCKGTNHPHFTEVYDGSSLHGGGLGNSGNHGGGGSQFFRCGPMSRLCSRASLSEWVLQVPGRRVFQRPHRHRVRAAGHALQWRRLLLRECCARRCPSI